ncbi:NADH-plastoquinone oxidoreductase subunit [Slackia heliotrinireducens]|uniref:Dissimilatory sulfite reductase (Desulfoviridin), alpha/beta subunit n=1 Tax=Slackia heliotrinireducens (strain ATCC 29202 / DSM 20476 / NCTC 11029 / RHS 1) TaxID=471855 RepID=C7N3T9_SLAHD|nr:4Fe-4S binding protein [Slackia heliotrinireducens]ACV21680.1 dissimilatory sulfite reductase (desulfoviridin), alpha/beta subunit [Slackia heliotrinireducens DSM 20476]VEG99301.1 NADH-plastoquinone oxidoreductase subunit [Slackia heliotrinireducens]
MSSVSDYMDLLERLESQSLLITAERCLMVRNRNARCNRCAAACVSGCINTHDNRIAIDAEKCIGCGTCATVCPTEAIAPRNPDDLEIARAAKQVMDRTGGRAVFTCAPMANRARHAVDPDTIVQVACLGRLDESLLVLLAAAGATSIRLVEGECEQCEYTEGSPVAHQVAFNASALLKAWGYTIPVRIGGTFPKSCRLQTDRTYDARRREVFLGVKDALQTSAAETADFFIERTFNRNVEKPQFEHVAEDGTLPHFYPRRRQLLQDALAELGDPELPDVTTRLMGRITIDQNLCNGCQMCAVFCPTAAIAKRVDENPSAAPAKLYRAPSNPNRTSQTAQDKPAFANPFAKRTQLLHAPSLCVQCGTCAAICPKHAVRLDATVPTAELVDGYTEVTDMQNIYDEKGGPDAIRNSMKKLIDSPYIWC